MERETGGKTAMAERARSFCFLVLFGRRGGALALGGKPGEQGKALLVRGGVTVRRRWWLEKGSGQGRRKSQNQKGCGCSFCFAKWVQPAGLEGMGF